MRLRSRDEILYIKIAREQALVYLLSRHAYKSTASSHHILRECVLIMCVSHIITSRSHTEILPNACACVHVFTSHALQLNATNSATASSYRRWPIHPNVCGRLCCLVGCTTWSEHRILWLIYRQFVLAMRAAHELNAFYSYTGHYESLSVGICVSNAGNAIIHQLHN